MKKIKSYLKSFLIAPFIIFLFNKMAILIDVFIPINIFTLVIVGLFKTIGLVMLTIFVLLY